MAEGIETPRIDHEHREHGRVRSDPYFWLRDDRREDPEVLAHLRRENAHTEEQLAHLVDLRKGLYDEIVGRIPGEDATVPAALDGYWVYSRNEKGAEYDIHCRLPLSAPEPRPMEGAVEGEQVILDENERAEGQEYYAAVGPSGSVDGKTMAVGEDTVGRRIYTIRFRDLDTGAYLPDAIEGTTGQVVWALDHRTVFYVKREEGTLRAYQVWRHTLGQEADTLVYQEDDEEFRVAIGRSRSRDYVLIGSFQTVTHEYRVVDARRPDGEPRLVFERQRGHEYDVDHLGGRFYIRTNWKARDFRLMSVEPEKSTDREAWREEVPAEPGVHLRELELFANHLVIAERRDTIAGLRVLRWGADGRVDLEGGYALSFEEPACFATIGHNLEPETGTLRLSYTSMTTPWSVIDHDMDTGERVVKKRQRVVGDFRPEDYRTERIEATASDGTAVPISLVHRADLDRSQPQPVVLYAYGSYGHSTDPTFSSPRLSLLDRGVIFAVAHVRGGQEKGRDWYDDGRLLNKRNTFTDYIDAARHLLEMGLTDRDRLFGLGGSAGGLLIGAVANMAPELFAGLVALVPFVDVVTTMLDESIPLTTFEYDEWGNPNDRQYFEYMLSYCPYDNVAAQAYPPMLVLSGLHDSQVQYWEPAKWVARLRDRNTADSRILLHMNMGAGHGGSSGRFRRHEETALAYAFVLDLLGWAER